jgi:beta-N-acetylglucosaminidase
MTSQILTIDSPMRLSNAQAQLQQTQQEQTQAQNAGDTIVDQQRSRLVEAMRSQYQLDQQVKFLHLQAEADSLLKQLQALKEQRQALEPSSSQ